MPGLLARRNRLVEDLAAIDLELAALRASFAPAPGAAGSAAPTRWLPIRGDQLRSGRLPLPAEIDPEDLDLRLGRLLVDERQAGRPLDGLELLVAFRPTGGRVLSIRTRRTGELAWVRRFELPAGAEDGRS